MRTFSAAGVPTNSAISDPVGTQPFRSAQFPDASHMLQRVQSASNVGLPRFPTGGPVEEPMTSVIDQGEAR
jgi:hypothetical protein